MLEHVAYSYLFIVEFNKVTFGGVVCTRIASLCVLFKHSMCSFRGGGQFHKGKPNAVTLPLLFFLYPKKSKYVIPNGDPPS